MDLLNPTDEEKAFVEARAGDALQELLGNDHVRVDVFNVYRCCDTLQYIEFLDTRGYGCRRKRQ